MKLGALAGALAAVVAVAVPVARAQQSVVLPPHSSVNGKALGVYASEWWQWSLSIPLDESPVKDLTGEKCGAGQTGDVWFLAGTYESSPVRRRCTIPSGKYVFFPVINMVYWRPPEQPVTCEAVKRAAALNNDSLGSIEVVIDGVKLQSPERHREASPSCFDVFARIPKDVPAPPGYPAASDGYWVMLKPMAAGKHTIRFRARYDRPGGAVGDLRQDVSYDITVGDR
jgi:hypothetical protein